MTRIRIDHRRPTIGCCRAGVSAITADEADTANHPPTTADEPRGEYAQIPGNEVDRRTPTTQNLMVFSRILRQRPRMTRMRYLHVRKLTVRGFPTFRPPGPKAPGICAHEPFGHLGCRRVRLLRTNRRIRNIAGGQASTPAKRGVARGCGKPKREPQRALRRGPPARHQHYPLAGS